MLNTNLSACIAEQAERMLSMSWVAILYIPSYFETAGVHHISFHVMFIVSYRQHCMRSIVKEIVCIGVAVTLMLPRACSLPGAIPKERGRNWADPLWKVLRWHFLPTARIICT